MKKFVLYLIIVLAGTIGIDLLFSFAVEKIISKGTVFSLFGGKKLASDITIFGASRAIRHYNPKIFADSMQCNIQVLGCPKKSILFHYTMFKSMLDRTSVKPKLVILELAEIDINSRNNSEELNVLYPFFYTETSVKEVLTDVLSSKELFMIKNSGIYRNNSNLIPYIKSLITSKTSSVVVGFTPLNNIWNKPIEENVEVGKVDSIKIKYFEKMIDLCEEEEIKLVFVMSPCYRLLLVENWKEVVNEIANKHNIPVIDYEQDSTFLAHQEWFYDSYHLNETGASIYSNIIVKELKTVLDNRLINID